MKCKCGKDLVRITVRGRSYCWSCYDESCKSQDALSAANIAETYKRYFMGGTVTGRIPIDVQLCGFCGETPCHPACDDETLSDAEAFARLQCRCRPFSKEELKQ
jgi:hypothetical protein